MLLLFGGGLIAGNLLGGRFADESIAITVLVILGLLAAGLMALWALGTVTAAVLILLVIIGAAGFGMVPPLQSYVIHVARTASPIVSALAAASFNAGVAIGSAVGGESLELVPSYELLPVAGAVVTAAGIAVFVLTHRTHNRRQQDTPCGVRGRDPLVRAPKLASRNPAPR